MLAIIVLYCSNATHMPEHPKRSAPSSLVLKKWHTSYLAVTPVAEQAWTETRTLIQLQMTVQEARALAASLHDSTALSTCPLP